MNISSMGEPVRLFPTFQRADICAVHTDRALELIREVYPICRSISGDGVGETLAHVARVIPLDVNEVPSGTPVLDWGIPREWNIRDACMADAVGQLVYFRYDAADANFRS